MSGKITRKRRGITNWNALTPRERHKLIIDLGCFDVERYLGSAAERCTTASNYARGLVSDAFGSAAAVLSEIGDAIAPTAEDTEHDSKLVPGEDF